MTGSKTFNKEINHPLTAKIVSFLEGIGLPVAIKPLDDMTFLPGISIDKGTICIDESKLKHPGDLLHEAGHLALMSPEDRCKASGDLEPGDGMSSDSLEIGAIAWSYAALTYLKLSPEVVFHEEGYRGSSQSFIENFRQGRYIGLPLLVWKGLSDNETYPHMTKWLV